MIVLVVILVYIIGANVVGIRFWRWAQTHVRHNLYCHSLSFGGGPICTCYSRQVWTGLAAAFWPITAAVLTEHAILTRPKRQRDTLESAQKTIDTLEKELGIGERERER